MNLADSVKYVLKSKSQNIFKEFWKSDVKGIISDYSGDISHAIKTGAKQVKDFKFAGFKVSASEMLESASDALTIFKIIPQRVKEGFIDFKDDLMYEIDMRPDKKQRAVFCLKVLGTLSSFFLGVLYNFKSGKSDLPVAGLKRKNAFTKFLVAELVFRISQVVILRFLEEVEKELEDSEELNTVRYFKALFSDREKMESEREFLGEDPPPGDPAIEIVDKLKYYILTGKRII